MQWYEGSSRSPWRDDLQMLNDELEDRAAAIETNVTPDTLSIGFSAMAEDVTRIMNLFAEVVASPALEESKLETIKAQSINMILHRNDDPSSIPSREVKKLVYGRTSPYVHEPNLQQIQSLTVEDVRKWIRTWERPDTAVLGIVGDFNVPAMESLIRQTFERSWTPNEPSNPPPLLPTPSLPDFTNVAGRTFIIDRPGALQASLATGEPGVQMMDPDECALDVLTDLFNGFDGTLFNQIRSKEGLAYSVGGGWTTSPPDHPGMFIAVAETEQPGALLQSLKKALQQTLNEPPKEEDVERAREENMNRFVFGFASPQGNLKRAVILELLRIPQDYPFVYMEKLGTVTSKDIQSAAGRHLHPDDQVIVIVGDAEKLKPSLEKLLKRKVEMLRLEDPLV